MSEIINLEKMCWLISKVNELMIKRIIEEVPESGKFGNITVSYNIPDTQNRGLLMVEPSLTVDDFRRLSVCVVRNETDRVYQNYVIHGSNSDLIEYLSDEKGVDKLKDIYIRLSQSADEFWD